LVILLISGIALMLSAPLLRRFHIASHTLAAGSVIVLILALVGLAHVDPRIGLAAIDENRRSNLFLLAVELPVLILALLSWKLFKWAFWIAWAINLCLALFLTVIIIWLEFFWHW